MIDVVAIDGLLDKAFHLACFIQRDREAAVRIVARALAKLELAATAQGKRLYYRPAGRPWLLRSQPDRLRNKISFNEPHLLQRLIYLESEPYEIAQEKGNGSTTDEEDLVIHFIKHLVGKTIKRNSFYVTLGLGRLLHSYTTSETMDIYHAVIQNPERVKDDFYYRSRKGVLMQELKQRFGNLINVCQGPRGEERFETDDNPSRFVELVRECLSFFTPWNTPCLISAGVDPIREGIPSLSYHGHNEEDEIEMNRIHAVLHPDCFGRLISDLRFDPPETRLDIPRFFYANDINNDSSTSRRQPAKLEEEELELIKSELDKNAARRKATHQGLLRVIVDGNERARFDLKETCRTHFHLDEDAEVIEVHSRDSFAEEVLLALHPLAYVDDKVQPATTSITLEGGQKISIVVSLDADKNDATVDISYGETNPVRAVSLLFHQMARSMSDNAARMIWHDRRILAPALAVLLLAIGLVGIIKYARKENAPAVEQSQATASRPTIALSKEGNTASGSSATDGNKTSNAEKTSRQQREGVGPPKPEGPARNSAQQRPDTGIPEEAAAEVGTETRSLKGRPIAVPLPSVKKIYVETVGDENLSQKLRKMLGERLVASNRIILAGNRDDADALLEVSIAKDAGAEPETIHVIVELINARGDVIWPENSSRKYQGSGYDVSARIVKDLLATIQNSRQQR